MTFPASSASGSRQIRMDKEIRPDFFKIKHNGVCECPNCGQRAELLAMGKYTNFENLRSRERAVQVRAYKDWLLVQAGYVFRQFDHEDMGGYINFEPFRMYAGHSQTPLCLILKKSGLISLSTVKPSMQLVQTHHRTFFPTASKKIRQGMVDG